jgi:hypothetical protein
MAIGSVVERGTFLTVYDERGRQITVVPRGPSGVLNGYTANTVSIRRGFFLFTYDERGRQISILTIGC